MKEFIEMGRDIISSEHGQMPKICEKCGEDMKFFMQALVGGPIMGDRITYKCISCKFTKSKFFPFPKEYKKLLGGGLT